MKRETYGRDVKKRKTYGYFCIQNKAKSLALLIVECFAKDKRTRTDKQMLSN